MSIRPNTVRISESSPRHAEWVKVFGTDKVEVQSPATQLVRVLGQVKRAYMLSLEALTPDQRRRLVEHIAEKFSIPASEVERDIDRQGVPILEEDTVCAFDARMLL